MILSYFVTFDLNTGLASNFVCLVETAMLFKEVNSVMAVGCMTLLFSFM